jgi:hypothetical protein
MYSPPNNMTTPTLTGIPIELLLEIAEHLKDSPAELSALCRTKAHFYATLTQSRRSRMKTIYISTCLLWLVVEVWL